MNENREYHAPMMADSAGNTEGPSDYSYAYSVYCTNCGFVATFMKRVVDETLQNTLSENQSE
jgi:hypothetical protein